MDETHRLRTSGTPISKFGKATGTMVKMDFYDYNMHMAFYILRLGPQFK
jgi:hypothetical protein